MEFISHTERYIDLEDPIRCWLTSDKLSKIIASVSTYDPSTHLTNADIADIADISKNDETSFKFCRTDGKYWRLETNQNNRSDIDEIHPQEWLQLLEE